MMRFCFLRRLAARVRVTVFYPKQLLDFLDRKKRSLVSFSTMRRVPGYLRCGQDGPVGRRACARF
jgi:hypothetical protein